MDAGRELDALVAEKVMDLRTRKVIVSEWVRGRDYADPGDYVIDWIPDETSSLCPEYSTDIAAAWQVVEAPILAQLLEYVEVSVIRYHDRYECHIENDTAAKLYITEATTASHAICLCALLVVGVRS